ncbi:MAG: hypothetical protein IBX64_06200 [Actinobacteria bacterium]|nr:hypothetical protein [Actinomycetota bacterium]
MAYKSIVSALQGVDFPVSKRSLVRQIGDREVEVLEGKMMSMREILRACEHDNYESPRDVTACPGIASKVRHAA